MGQKGWQKRDGTKAVGQKRWDKRDGTKGVGQKEVGLKRWDKRGGSTAVGRKRWAISISTISLSIISINSISTISLPSLSLPSLSLPSLPLSLPYPYHLPTFDMSMGQKGWDKRGGTKGVVRKRQEIRVGTEWRGERGEGQKG